MQGWGAACVILVLGIGLMAQFEQFSGGYLSLQNDWPANDAIASKQCTAQDPLVVIKLQLYIITNKRDARPSHHLK